MLYFGEYLIIWLPGLNTCLSIFYLKIVISLFFLVKWRRNSHSCDTCIFFGLSDLDILLLETFNDLFWNLINEGNLTLVESKTHYIKSESLVSSLFHSYCSVPALIVFFISVLGETYTRNFASQFLWVPGTSAQRPIKESMKMVTSFLLLIMVHFLLHTIGKLMFYRFLDNKYTKFIMLALYVFPSGHCSCWFWETTS